MAFQVVGDFPDGPFGDYDLVIRLLCPDDCPKQSSRRAPELGQAARFDHPHGVRQPFPTAVPTLPSQVRT